MNKKVIETAVRMSLEEDIGTEDITTTQLIAARKVVNAVVVSQEESAILCGIPWFEMVYHQIDPGVKIDWNVNEGFRIVKGQLFVKLTGKARSILTGERTALNWLQTLSGTATLVRFYTEKLKNTKIQLFDTRKTIPCIRYAQKYAVRCGGGKNHRMGLYDAFLIKENHIVVCGSITAAIQKAQNYSPKKLIEVEVESIEELQEALSAKADVIMLDNFDVDSIKKAIAINNGQSRLEVSGNINLQNIQEIRKTGIDFISVGAITKHVNSVDFSMRVLS
ncbi:carboxylating nicotinate-nucleotide diphosphorylase [Coxiella endosymbiont of Amblyomma americanum]|uniref:carboxylating nicotinate-nucleotide diphosphorylase n=1 Tax=Coxiella endosymbiont of Amblyomma americanum TaxID=325775 RepID=UPI00057EB635|nr:carboxylating nicotinate-nucleotide diphosphorylase [Coxiella endosymbiont of Amblyomma americanum]AJC50382.1 nicotinate-nucleotide pyrophosphorylase [Coxiella endosymbiont of Amblyomma americanum]AUJ58724.1 nicotinate-nucleotide diphosphorylase (carboxylating) [Coxiella-like endosymbiont of Amblyomma americanum]